MHGSGFHILRILITGLFIMSTMLYEDVLSRSFPFVEIHFISATGNTGMAGPVGSPGLDGLPGATGSQGPAGSTGPSGATGQPGSQGKVIEQRMLFRRGNSSR